MHNHKFPFPVSKGHCLRPARSAFTLIEMLVVIAIIALLASLIIPATSRAFERARRAKCAQNIRSLVQGLVAYSTDHNGYFPGTRPDSNSWPYGADWAVRYSTFYKDYVSDKSAYFCPTGMANDPKSESAKNFETFPDPASGAWRPNTSYNYFYGGNAWGGKNENGRGGYATLDLVPNPSSSTIIADIMKLGEKKPELDTPPSSSWNHREKTIRKSGGNLGYADGHVAWFDGRNGIPDDMVTQSGSRYYVNEQKK